MLFGVSCNPKHPGRKTCHTLSSPLKSPLSLSLSLFSLLSHQVVYPLLGASSRGERGVQTWGLPRTAGPAASRAWSGAPTSTELTSMCSLLVPPTSWPARRVSRVQYLMSYTRSGRACGMEGRVGAELLRERGGESG